MNTIQRVAKNFFALFFSGAVVQGIDFLVTIHFAKVLGPIGFGMISFALVLSSFFTLAATLGFPILGIREIARTPEYEKKWISGILLFRIGISTLTFSLLCCFPYFIHKSSDLKFLIVLYGFNLFPMALYLDWVFRGRERMEYVGYARIVGIFVYALCVFLFVSGHNYILFVPMFYIMGNLATVLLFFFFYIRLFGNFRLSIPSLNFMKHMLSRSVPIGLSTLMVNSIYYMDTILLKFFAGDKAVGYYNAGYRIILLLTTLIAVYFYVVFPLLSKYFLQSKKYLRMLHNYNVQVMIAIGFLATTIGSVLAEPIIEFLYGAAYGPSLIAFRILIWSFTFICINTPFAWGLWACDRQNAYFKIVTVQFFVNLGFNLWLIPPYGIVGAGLATVAAELIGIPFYIGAFSKIVSVDCTSFTIKTCFASAVTGAFLFSIMNSFPLFFLLMAGAAMFMVILTLTKGITLQYAKELKNILTEKSN